MQKKCLRLTKLTLLYFRRIVFVRGHFQVSPLAKIRSNLGGGFLTDQYMLYGLSEPSRKKEYLSEFDWYRSRYINAPYDFLLNNKVACTQLLQPLVHVPAILAMRNNGVLSNFQKDVLDEHQVIHILRRCGNAFFKPSNKGKGIGVCRMSWDGDYRIDGKICEEKDILETMHQYKDWILCETIQQGPFPASLYDKTVNTMRIITFRNVETEHFEVFLPCSESAHETPFLLITAAAAAWLPVSIWKAENSAKPVVFIIWMFTRSILIPEQRSGAPGFPDGRRSRRMSLLCPESSPIFRLLHGILS